MHSRGVDRAGDHLHGSALAGAPCSDRDALHSAARGGKQGAVPSEKPFLSQRRMEMLRGIQHDLHDGFHVTAGWPGAAGIPHQAAAQ